MTQTVANTTDDDDQRNAYIVSYIGREQSWSEKDDGTHSVKRYWILMPNL